MSMIYSDYNRDRIGWFFGVSGWQLALLAASALPVIISLQDGAWMAALLFSAVWLLVLVITVVPVRGRSATGWFLASTAFAIGGLARWTRWRSKASTGQIENLTEADLPGVLNGVDVHDGPPQGPELVRVAIIQNHAAKTWAVTAAITHPGIGMRDSHDRDRQAQGLSELLDLASRTELIDELLIMVRTVPDDGAERDLWIAGHRRSSGPSLARQVNDDLRQRLTAASVRTEAFVTIVVPETRIARPAKESGGGLDGRARVLYGLMGEVEAQLRGGLAMTQVTWLTSPELAVACRTGFAPADRASIVEALAAQAKEPGVNADVPWAMAGPSGGRLGGPLLQPRRLELGQLHHQTARQGVGDRCSRASLDPGRGGGAPQRPGRVSDPAAKRRGPAYRQQRMGRRPWGGAAAQSQSEAARQEPRGNRQGPRPRRQAGTRQCAHPPVRGVHGHRPQNRPIAEFGRRLDAAVRRAGYAPMRLDLSHDVGFAASVVPLGVSLTRRGDA